MKTADAPQDVGMFCKWSTFHLWTKRDAHEFKGGEVLEIALHDLGYTGDTSTRLWRGACTSSTHAHCPVRLL